MPHTVTIGKLTFERQVFGLQTFFLKLENVPATGGKLRRTKLRRRCKATDLHRTKELADEISRKSSLLKIFFSSEADVATVQQTLRILALGTSDRGEISSTFQLLINIVNLGLGFGIALSVALRDSLLAIVGRIDNDHRQRNTARINELLLVGVVVILNLAIADRNFAGILVLQRIDCEVFLCLLTQRLHSHILLFELAGKLFISQSLLLLLLVNRGGYLFLGGQKL